MANLVANGGIGLVSFPLDLYAGVLRFTFTFIMPIGLCVYVPVLTMLGRDGPGPLGPGLLAALPLALVMIIGGTGLAWRSGLRHYQTLILQRGVSHD